MSEKVVSLLELLMDDSHEPRKHSKLIKRIKETSVRNMERWNSKEENQHRIYHTTNPLNGSPFYAYRPLQDKMGN